MEKSFFLKQTTNTSRTRVDSIKYKVDINTMEHLSVENGRLTKEDIPMQLNQIAHVVLTSSKNCSSILIPKIRQPALSYSSTRLPTIPVPLV